MYHYCIICIISCIIVSLYVFCILVFLANFKWKFDTMHKLFDNKFDSYQL